MHKSSRKISSQTPILVPPNWVKEFHVHADASMTAVGVVLCQAGEDKLDHPIYYASRNLSDAERNYTTTEKECLSMVFAIEKFRHYLLGNKFIFYVDHEALKYLLNKPELSGRVTRWMLLFQEFSFEVVTKAGKTHVLADHLSRLLTNDQEFGVEGELPDSQLFLMQVETHGMLTLLIF